jgi:hypothetical protein
MVRDGSFSMRAAMSLNEVSSSEASSISRRVSGERDGRSLPDSSPLMNLSLFHAKLSLLLINYIGER